jgi:hypothetical protein
MLLAAAKSASQCSPAGVSFWDSAVQYFTELFSLAYWWAVFLAFGERMRSLTSVLQSIALNLHIFD